MRHNASNSAQHFVKGDPSLTSVGQTIAAYRQLRFVPNTRTPWSQEELALASGTNQAHISRIESNRKHPQYSTLVRICEALSLPAARRSYLLALAGYPIEPPLPTEAEVETTLRELTPVVKSYPYPALLMDEGERVWYVNPLVATLWGACLGSSDHTRCIASVRSKRALQFVFHPTFQYIWRAYFKNLGPIMDRVVSLFWRAYYLRPHDPELNQTLASLKTNPDFLQRWQDLEEGNTKLLFVEHGWFPLNNPDFQPLLFSIWRTTSAADERFIVAHFMPADEITRQVVTDLLRS